MDCLINNSKDVDVLVHQDIINNMLGDSNEVVKLFNGLCKDIDHINFNSNYLEICEGLNEFCKDRWNNWKATLRNDYCNTPWKTAASIAAIVLLVLTILQTICSVIQINHAYREKNRCADSLARTAIKSRDPFVIYNTVPNELFLLLWADLSGINYARNCKGTFDPGKLCFSLSQGSSVLASLFVSIRFWYVVVVLDSVC
ncbi:UPF0481 protein [Senna tora]|uniref:UPF0481 protein n=1 Tax=Senna tora TaxID=362788 RepID=A0A834U1G5_9FABA|nr:UPF0481 protein [Senna tora]